MGPAQTDTLGEEKIEGGTVTDKKASLTRARIKGDSERQDIDIKVFDSLSRLLDNSLYAIATHPGGRQIILCEGEVFRLMRDAARMAYRENEDEGEG